MTGCSRKVGDGEARCGGVASGVEAFAQHVREQSMMAHHENVRRCRRWPARGSLVDTLPCSWHRASRIKVECSDTFKESFFVG